MSDDRPPGDQENPPGSEPPSYGSPPPPQYGSQPPEHGAQPPDYGSQPPAYGSQPPGYGSQPPGYGFQPPGDGSQPPGEYGVQPSEHGFSVGDAFGFGWRKYWANVGPILLAALVYLAAVVLVQVLQLVFLGNDPQGASGAFGSLFFSALSFVVSAVMQAGIARGVLEILAGRRLDVATMFTFDNLGTVILASLLVGIATAIGFVLLIIPGLVVIFFSQFFVWFIVDKHLGAIESITASFRLVGRNFGPLLLFFLASLLAYLLGALALVIGLLVAAPVVYIAQGYAFRTLQGEPVSA